MQWSDVMLQAHVDHIIMVKSQMQSEQTHHDAAAAADDDNGDDYDVVDDDVSFSDKRSI